MAWIILHGNGSVDNIGPLPLEEMANVMLILEHCGHLRKAAERTIHGLAAGGTVSSHCRTPKPLIHPSVRGG